jgi:hypothetical protein
MLHCPHCLNNWPCNEPLQACTRRKEYIMRALASGSRTRRSVPKDSRAQRSGATLAELPRTNKIPNPSFGFFKWGIYLTEEVDPKLWRKWNSRYLGVNVNKYRKQLETPVSGPANEGGSKAPEG